MHNRLFSDGESRSCPQNNLEVLSLPRQNFQRYSLYIPNDTFISASNSYNLYSSSHPPLLCAHCIKQKAHTDKCAANNAGYTVSRQVILAIKSAVWQHFLD